MPKYFRLALPIPRGARLIEWHPKPPPVELSRYETVTNTDRFVRTTLRQLDHCLKGETWLSGNWPLPMLLARLEAVGCVVELEDKRRTLQ
jgi:hypothetical protein